MARKQTKNKVPSKVWTKYKVEGDKLIKKQICPKCGEGYFLAEHKNRVYCGKCHYTHFQTK